MDASVRTPLTSGAVVKGWCHQIVAFFGWLASCLRRAASRSHAETGDDVDLELGYSANSPNCGHAQADEESVVLCVVPTPARRNGRVFVDASTQCSADDMLEPMARTGLFQKNMKMLLEKGDLHTATTYSPNTHFSAYHDISDVVDAAVSSDDHNLKTLANLFLGTSVAGIQVRNVRCRPARRIPDRHVHEAGRVAAQVPHFRKHLLQSASQLFFGGLSGTGLPLDGRGLLCLACDDPQTWTALVRTAIEFAARLVSAHALPEAFEVSLLGFGASRCRPEVLLPLFAARCARGRDVSPTEKLFRAVSALCVGSKPLMSLGVSKLPRSSSAPTAFTPSVAHKGTCIRAQDPGHVYTRLSIDGISGQARPTIIESAIPAREVSYYWRHAAGGEHSAAELERRACEAETAVNDVSEEKR